MSRTMNIIHERLFEECNFRSVDEFRKLFPKKKEEKPRDLHLFLLDLFNS